MASITEFLFPAPARRAPLAIIRWWESRRLRFNMLVGGAGVVSLGATSLFTSLPPRAHGMPLDAIPQVVLVFGVLANVCYFLGPAAEIAIERVWRGRVLPAGPTLFRMGLTFSVGLALFPALFTGIEWLFRVITSLF